MTPDKIRKAQGGRLKAARIAAHLKSAYAAADRFGWSRSTYSSHERGSRTIGFDDADRYARAFRNLGVRVTGREIMHGDDAEMEPEIRNENVVAIMGLIGAGAVIEPEYEQIPEEGIYEVEIAFPVPDGLIGFQVEGDSMLSRYAHGDVVIVYRDPQRSIENFFGEEVAVLTTDGRRYLKQLKPGKNRRVVDLHSYNGAAAIEGVSLEWIGEIHSVVRAKQVQRLEKQHHRKAAKLLAGPK